MHNLKRLFAAATMAAGLASLIAAPAAAASTAGDTPANGTAVTSLAGLALRPAHLPGKAGRYAAQADEPAYLIGPVSDPNRCLDADLNTIGRNGTKVQLWTCNNTSANQAWYVRQIPEGYYRFQNVYSGRYLDADLNTINRNGTVIQLWDFIGSAHNQWFNMTEIPEHYLRLQNVQSGRYLDADLNTTGRDGTVVQLWDFVGSARNQWWG